MNNNSKFIFVAAAIIAVSLIVSLVGIFNGWIILVTIMVMKIINTKSLDLQVSNNEQHKINYLKIELWSDRYESEFGLCLSLADATTRKNNNNPNNYYFLQKQMLIQGIPMWLPSLIAWMILRMVGTMHLDILLNYTKRHCSNIHKKSI